MDEKRIKVINSCGHRVGVALQDGRQFNLQPGVALPQSEDDLFYLQATTTFFTSGMLRIEQAHQDMNEKLGIDVANNPNFVTDDEIRTRLTGSATRIEAWAKNITELYVQNRVWHIANEMDLSASRIKALQRAIPREIEQ